MSNFPLMTAGILGAVALTAGVAMAVSNSNSSAKAPMEIAELDGSAKNDSGKATRIKAEPSRGISEAEMQARLADERADANRRAEARLACERERQEASNRGAVVGGVAGAVIGSQVAGSGARSEGSVIGGVAGVLAGRQVAKKDHRC